MEEQWAEIEDYSLYKVSNTGKVWSKQWDRELKQGYFPNGYRVTLLSDKYDRKSFKVSDLVEQAFGKK